MFDSRQAAAFLSHSLAFRWRKRFNSHLSPIEDKFGIDLSPIKSQINISRGAFCPFHSFPGDWAHVLLEERTTITIRVEWLSAKLLSSLFTSRLIAAQSATTLAASAAAPV
jgi:hypothetical protein